MNDILTSINWIKNFRRRMPNKGRSYFAYRLLNSDGRSRFDGHWPMEFAFNYLGQHQRAERKDALLQPVDGISGQSINTLSDIGPTVPRLSLFEISSIITEGCLKLSFGYNKFMNHHSSIQKWILGCKHLLGDFAQLLSERKRLPIVPDYRLLPLTFGGSEKLVEELLKLGISSPNELEDVYPCSPMQRGILFSQMKDPGKYAYTAIFEVLSHNPYLQIDSQRLEKAWKQVVQRHPSLRTVFINSICEDGLMDQAVLKSFDPRILQFQTEPSNLHEVLAATSPLEYNEKQPPHRFTICSTSSGRVFCRLEMSHAIFDGSSIPVILHELAQAYDSRTSTASGPLYSDFISHLQSLPREDGINYWKNYLSGVEPCFLPSLSDGNESKTRKLGSLTRRIHHASQLQSFCMKQGLTPANVLQLIWGLVLRCYTGSSEVCFGYVASGRDLPVEGIQDAVGAFINMLICRLDLSDNVKVRDTLRKAKLDFMSSMEYQSCSLAEVQHELGLSDTSLFNTVFTFQRRTGASEPKDSSIRFETIEAEDPNEYNMSVNIEAADSHLDVDFGYWSDKVSDAQAENIANTFEHLLTALTNTDNSDLVIGDLDFLDKQSNQKISSWNNLYPTEVNTCVHDLIKQRSLYRSSSAMAVCAWDVSLTYTQLEDLTTRLASHLRELGVQPEVYVPLCFEKSGWTIVSQLAVLKAGGAFVPLDPTHPEARLRGLVEEVDASLVLCSPQYQQKASNFAKDIFVVSNHSISQIETFITEPSASPTPSNAAYVIFTSGTTGRPKGTVIEHGSICTSSIAHGEALLMNDSSRVLQFASYTFDASILEIITALIMGACICVPNDEDRMNDLPKVISDLQVNWALLTPSVATTVKPESVPTLKVLVTGGEAMAAQHIEKWRGGPAILNAYGPTECSIVASTSTKVDENGMLIDGNRFSIGAAVGGRSWLVNPQNYNRLVPVGAIGELLMEGRTVARGYLKNQEKTNEAFVANPGWAKSLSLKKGISKTQRMYRTGDLVRYNSDGSLCYISRKDTQIKLNGQRIEIGEIEHQCKTYLPEQTQVAVELVVPPGRGSSKSLVVYFVSQSKETSNNIALLKADGSSADDLLLPMSDSIRSIAKSLESSLAASLPTYMIPQLFVPISKMPWVSSGKLDRRRLRDMVENLSAESTKPYRLVGSKNQRRPATEIEKKLQYLWEKVLGLAPGSVGIEDSFFRLGGDSLAAMNLVGAARSEGIVLSVINIFRQSILSKLAKSCTPIGEDIHTGIKPFSLLQNSGNIDNIIDEAAGYCHIAKQQVKDIYPASSLQEGLVTLSVKQPGAYVARNVFRLGPNVDIEKFQTAWQTVVNNLDTLRTRIVHTAASQFLQVVINEESIIWHSAETLNEVEDSVCEIPAYNGGPLAKYTLITERNPINHYFVLSIHHALYDGWSLPLILQRVEQAYFGGGSIRPAVPYVDFINYLSNKDIQSSEEFWKSNLSDISAANFPQIPGLSSNDACETRTLNHQIDIPQSHIGGNITLPSVIRAGWATVIAGHTGLNDVCFGETLAGRNIDVDGISDIVGPTLTTVPTRMRINPSSTVADFLTSVGQKAMEIIPHQHLGLQHIKRLDSDTSEACDFQNLLVIQMAESKGREGFWDFQTSGDTKNFFTYPLVLECRMSNRSVETVFYYKENIVSSWQVQRIADQFSFVLKQLLKASNDKQKLVREIIVSSPRDDEEVSWWNRQKPMLVDECIHETFAKRAALQPQKPAISSSSGEMTYAELNDHASRLAMYLSSTLKVGPEVFVPICFEKSACCIIAILAVLKAGGAFVSLDPTHPTSRHEEIVKDVNANILLCSPSYQQRYRSIVNQVVPISQGFVDRLALHYDNLLPSLATSKNSAYVIFTSGSTGRAKGIVIEHKAFNSSSSSFGPETLMNSDSRVLQFGSLSFDVAMMEILTALTLGGCLCIPDEEERLRDISAAIRRLGVTWAFFTPSVANIVDPSTVPGLKVLACGGEAMSAEVISKWADKVRLVNAYGPSESSVIATVNSRVSFDRSATCIGKGTASTLTWILDPTDHNKLAPLGAAGELALEGPTLARCYINNPQKTAESFIEMPHWASRFKSQSPRRIYKTGDLVKYNPNGTLEFLGRKDDQVKLNGQRMELGEIEHRLYMDSRIRHILVVLPKSGLFEKRLVAVITLNNLTMDCSKLPSDEFELLSDTELNRARSQLSEIRNRLCDQLPPYMVPQAWAVVTGIPLLASGKLDRKRISRWIQNADINTFEKIMGSDDEDTNEVEVTGTAKILQQIWSTVLNIPLSRVKLSQSFLSLGEI